MPRIALCLLLVGPALAGCLEPAADAVPPIIDATAGAHLVLLGNQVAVGQPVTWQGRVLTTQAVGGEGCGPDDCERVPFRLDQPLGADLVLQAALTWLPDGNTGDTDPAFPNFDLRILDAEGRQVARSSLYKWSAHILLTDLAPGEYVAEVQVRHLNPAYYAPWAMYSLGVPYLEPPVPYPNPVAARGSYRGVLLLAEPHVAQGPDLLPDLLVQSLLDLRVAYAPLGQGHASPPAVVTVEMPTAPGCTDDEYLEGARRCLRFTVGLGNVGEGPLELAYEHTATSRTTEELVPAVQCITRSDGGGTTRAAGQGSYHRIHGHDHQRDILAYDLHPYDESTGMRGEAVRTGEKFGYGFYRQGLVDEGAALAWPADHPSGCGLGFPYWLHPGWYDIYMYWRTGQYIDISGVQDGTYLLAATVNPAGDILESDATNNEASVVFRLAGNDVTVIRSWHHVPQA